MDSFICVGSILFLRPRWFQQLPRSATCLHFQLRHPKKELTPPCVAANLVS